MDRCQDCGRESNDLIFYSIPNDVPRIFCEECRTRWDQERRFEDRPCPRCQEINNPNSVLRFMAGGGYNCSINTTPHRFRLHNGNLAEQIPNGNEYFMRNNTWFIVTWTPRVI